MKYLALALLCACTYDVNHHFPEGDIEVGLDTECAACFPLCRYDGIPYCETAEGFRCYGCTVGCLAGKTLDCSEDAPTCTNDSPTGTVDVPVFCVPDVD